MLACFFPKLVLNCVGDHGPEASPQFNLSSNCRAVDLGEAEIFGCSHLSSLFDPLCAMYSTTAKQPQTMMLLGKVLTHPNNFYLHTVI